MQFTDQGTKIKHDWMPLAFANGVEWSRQRRGMPDQFGNLYRRRWGLNGLLWYAGAIWGALV